MVPLLIVLNVFAYVLSLGAILWAWVAVRGDIARNAKVLQELRAIDMRYELVLITADTYKERKAATFAEYRQAGKYFFSNHDLQHAPEKVKSMIFHHALGGLRSQVALVGLGLTLGTVANIWSLFLSSSRSSGRGGGYPSILRKACPRSDNASCRVLGVESMRLVLISDC